MAGGGFGSGPWGGTPWGGSTLIGEVSVYETVDLFESFSITLPLRVETAIALNAFLVQVNFAHALDGTYAPNFDPTSYAIAGLTVLNVLSGPTPESVWLHTTEQGPLVYTVVVLDAKSATGDFIDPLNDTAIFAGWPIEPTVFATAQSAVKVQLTFSTEMLQNSAYTNSVNYFVMDLNGASIPILAVMAVGTSPNRRVALELGSPLVPGGYYVASVLSPPIQTVFTLPILPAYDLFRWDQAPTSAGVTTFTIKLSDFTGEVTGGILGDPLGLVFFSPSLEVAAPNSSIQVDDVSVCTRAFDVYTIPSPPDPSPLYTFSSNGPSGTIGGSVLFAPFERLLGASLNFTLQPSDALGPYVDGPAAAILSEPFDPAYVSLLNNSFWTIYDGLGTPFITANNLAPIPPGPTQVITLQGLPESIMAESFGGDPWGAEDWG